MNLKNLISIRKFEEKMFWQIVWEWEDAICTELDIACKNRSTYCFGQNISIIDRVLYHEKISFLDSMRNTECKAIHFWMNPPYHRGPLTKPSVIPIIIDCWRHELRRVAKYFSNHRAIFIGSLEAVIKLREDESLPVYFLPVSLPQAARLPFIPEKDIDILTYSRTHYDLLDWGKRLSIKMPKIQYVHAFTRNGRSYVRDKYGEKEMPIDRANLMNLLRRSKVVLQSSPGLEECNKARTGGFNPVTPRFLEAASCYCQMVGIYPSNPDFMEMNVSQVCHRVNNYEEFESVVTQALLNPFNEAMKAIFDQWLDDHSTEVRARYIKDTISPP